MNHFLLYGWLYHAFLIGGAVLLVLVAATLRPKPPRKHSLPADHGGTSLDAWASGLLVSISTLVVVRFLLMQLGVWGDYANLPAILSTGATAYLYFRHSMRAPSSHIGLREYAEPIAILGFVSVYLYYIYAKGIILPANDPVAVPTFASVISRGWTPWSYYKLGDSGYSYPPGFPVLLSVFYAFTHSLGVLAIFKAICLAAVAFMPLSWAIMTRRIFRIDMSVRDVVLAFYVAAFGIERTLNFALPFAGKNAQLLMLVFFPLFILMAFRKERMPIAQMSALSLATLALLLVHYSALYLMAAVLLPISVLMIAEKRKSLAEVAQVGFAIVVGLGLFLILNGNALRDPRSTLGAHVDLTHALHYFINSFIAQNGSALAIFNSPQFEPVGSPIRGWLLASCVAFAYLTSRLLSDSEGGNAARSVFLAAVSLLLSVAVSMLFGSGLLPLGVNSDFARWFIFPAQTAVIASAVMCAALLVRYRAHKVGVAILVLTSCVTASVFAADTVRIKHTVDAGAIDTNTLRAMRSSFAPGPGGCIILAPNQTVITNFTYGQRYRFLEYAEMITPCRMLNGSWVHGSSVDLKALEISGLSAADASYYRAKGDNIYFFGTKTELAKYGGSGTWTRLSAQQNQIATTWKLQWPHPTGHF